jgi:hypothetical protein
VAKSRASPAIQRAVADTGGGIERAKEIGGLTVIGTTVDDQAAGSLTVGVHAGVCAG